MILRSAAQELGNATDFVAHLGGQQFAFVSNPVRAEVVASRALENADALFLLQYNEWDRARFASGGSAAGSRIALFFGLVDVTSFQGVHPVALLDQAADALTDAKKTPNRPLDRRPAMGPSVSSLA
jgi:GGDEF domain-containing protein